MAVLARYRPRPAAIFTPVSLQSKYQNVRMKDMLRSALGAPPAPTANSLYSAVTPSDPLSGRNLSLGMMGAPNSATTENFPNVGFGGAPLSAGLDPPVNAGGSGLASRRQSSIGGINVGGGPRQILPGQLPGPGPQQRKGSVASSIGAP